MWAAPGSPCILTSLSHKYKHFLKYWQALEHKRLTHNTAVYKWGRHQGELAYDLSTAHACLYLQSTKGRGTISILPTAHLVFHCWIMVVTFMKRRFCTKIFVLVSYLYIMGRTFLKNEEEVSEYCIWVIHVFSGRSGLRTQITKDSGPLSVFLMSSQHFSNYRWKGQSPTITSTWAFMMKGPNHCMTWQHMICACFLASITGMRYDLAVSLKESWQTQQQFHTHIYHDPQGHDTMQSGMWVPTLQWNTLPPSSGQKWIKLGKWQVRQKLAERKQVMNDASSQPPLRTRGTWWSRSRNKEINIFWPVCALQRKLAEAMMFLTCVQRVFGSNLNGMLTILCKVACSFLQSRQADSRIVLQTLPQPCPSISFPVIKMLWW
jgi:hypothetical protein